MSSIDEGPSSEIIGQLSGFEVPRYAGLTTFARLPRLQDVGRADIAVVGVPFDSGVTYRPGARFGPAHIRQSSRLLRSYHPGLRVSPFAMKQVVDAGDVSANPFSIERAIAEIATEAEALMEQGMRLVAMGGDHTIALPLLRATARKYGPVALVHFDAHLDTWDTYFDAPYTHGTPFRRAAEEGLMLQDKCVHVGIRGPLYSQSDLDEDRDLGFFVVAVTEFDTAGFQALAERVRQRVGNSPLYVSVDIDVLDPGAAPATGTPEAGGLSSRELLSFLRALEGLNLVGADLVEVAPAYDHAEVTGIAAAHVIYELVSLMAKLQ